jgi:hypothetical protein
MRAEDACGPRHGVSCCAAGRAPTWLRMLRRAYSWRAVPALTLPGTDTRSQAHWNRSAPACILWKLDVSCTFRLIHAPIESRGSHLTKLNPCAQQIKHLLSRTGVGLKHQREGRGTDTERIVRAYRVQIVSVFNDTDTPSLQLSTTLGIVALPPIFKLC